MNESTGCISVCFQACLSDLPLWMDSVWDKVRVKGPLEQLCKLVTKLIYCPAEPSGEVIRGSWGHTHTHAQIHTKTHKPQAACHTRCCYAPESDMTPPAWIQLLRSSKQYYINKKYWSIVTKCSTMIPKPKTFHFSEMRSLKSYFPLMFHILFCWWHEMLHLALWDHHKAEV